MQCWLGAEPIRSAIGCLGAGDDLADVQQRNLVPVHLVWGERDAFFPLAWAEELGDTFPDARLSVVKGAGLFSHEKGPDVVTKALLPTLLGAR